jgi:hypothetical protein
METIKAWRYIWSDWLAIAAQGGNLNASQVSQPEYRSGADWY